MILYHITFWGSRALLLCAKFVLVVGLLKSVQEPLERLCILLPFWAYSFSGRSHPYGIRGLRNIVVTNQECLLDIFSGIWRNKASDPKSKKPDRFVEGCVVVKRLCNIRNVLKRAMVILSSWWPGFFLARQSCREDGLLLQPENCLLT